MFWNQPEEWDGDLGRDIDAVYAAHAPEVLRATEQWTLDATIEQLEARGDFEAVTKLTRALGRSRTRPTSTSR